jgi:hypothetical protein
LDILNRFWAQVAVSLLKPVMPFQKRNGCYETVSELKRLYSYQWLRFIFDPVVTSLMFIELR